MTWKFLGQMVADVWRRALRFVAPHLRKWSTQIAGVELLAIYPILFSLVNVVDVHLLLTVAAGIAALKLLAGFLSQKRVATYDPTTHRVVPRLKREAGDE